MYSKLTKLAALYNPAVNEHSSRSWKPTLPNMLTSCHAIKVHSHPFPRIQSMLSYLIYTWPWIEFTSIAMFWFHYFILQLLYIYTLILLYYKHVKGLRGYCTSNLKLACFGHYLEISNTFMKKTIYIFMQIVQETQNKHWNFSKLSGF